MGIHVAIYVSILKSAWELNVWSSLLITYFVINNLIHSYIEPLKTFCVHVLILKTTCTCTCKKWYILLCTCETDFSVLCLLEITCRLILGYIKEWIINIMWLSEILFQTGCKTSCTCMYVESIVSQLTFHLCMCNDIICTDTKLNLE